MSVPAHRNARLLRRPRTSLRMSLPEDKLALHAPDELLKSWREIIPARHSRRTYRPESLGEDVLDRLRSFCHRLPATKRARVAVAEQIGDDLFRGIVGSYGRISGAPSALIMVGLADPAAVEAVGYVGEAAVLEATRDGLDTCWIGGFFEHAKAAGYVDLRPRERVWAVSPIGRATTSRRFSERLMKRAARSTDRMPSQRLVSDARLEQWPAWARKGLTLARLAPSAVNRQPWRFSLDADGSVTVAEDRTSRSYGIPKRLDCGIAMLHFEIGARSEGVPGEWESLAGTRVARYRPLQPPPSS